MKQLTVAEKSAIQTYLDLIQVNATYLFKNDSTKHHLQVFQFMNPNLDIDYKVVRGNKELDNWYMTKDVKM